LIVETKKLMKE